MTRQVLIFEAEFDSDEEPIPFELRIKNRSTGETRAELFHALADPGIGGDIAVTAVTRRHPTDVTKTITDLAGLRVFFSRVLVDGDYERLEALLDDKSWTVPMSMLGAAFNALVSEYAARPSQPSSVSSSGPAETGPTSMAASS